jgi:hypothetical protein
MKNEEIILEGLNANEIWEKLYNKKLDSKKNILEYIETTKILKKEEIDFDQIQDVYKMIYESIEKMDNIKPNTSMFLKNQLKKQLGKYVVDKDPQEVNYFIEYFKEAYPPKERRKDFTWVLMDINKIADEQIWHTLTYINTCILDGETLGEREKSDIIQVIQILLNRGNTKLINNFKSLQAINNELNIKILLKKNKYICIK